MSLDEVINKIALVLLVPFAIGVLIFGTYVLYIIVSGAYSLSPLFGWALGVWVAAVTLLLIAATVREVLRK